MGADDPRFEYFVLNSLEQNVTTILTQICDDPEKGYSQNNLKLILNGWKSQLSDMNIAEWSTHTDTMNPAFTVVKKLKEEIGHSFITNAWVKFWEILSQFPSLTSEALCPETGIFRSVHLCEAPGGFVSALDHFLAMKGTGEKWSWTANSLHPHYEGSEVGAPITDDRFIMGTWENWFWCEDGTGNIMSRRNIESIVQFCGPGQSHLVTADGSINCMGDPGEQENMVARLFFCEVVAAIGLLAEGGNFVIKMFTTFESTTSSILYLLAFLFHKVTITKPAASKSGNSEVYVVCENFRKVKVGDELWSDLVDVVESGRCFVVEKEAIEGEFLKSLNRCSVHFSNCQITAIQRNLRLWNLHSNPQEYHSAVNSMRTLQESFACSYQKKYSLYQVDSTTMSEAYDSLSFWGKISRCYRHRHYFSDLIEKFSLPRIEKLLKHSKEEYELSVKSDLSSVQFEKCRPFEVLTHSKFVHKDLLEPFLLHLSLEEVKSHVWCRNTCLDGCICRLTESVPGFLEELKSRVRVVAEWREKTVQALTLQNLQLLTRRQIGVFSVVASCFESVVFEPCSGTIRFYDLRESWEDTWRKYLEEGSELVSGEKCVKVHDICRGTFLEDPNYYGEDFLYQALVAYNECYLLRYLKSVTE